MVLLCRYPRLACCIGLVQVFDDMRSSIFPRSLKVCCCGEKRDVPMLLHDKSENTWYRECLPDALLPWHPSCVDRMIGSAGIKGSR